jgi:endonuclease/exonuclease/phosphatase family metal-dependent hydrolase
MKIVSWNILANEFIKKNDYPMIAEKTLFNRKERLAHILRVLECIDADIMLLQEVMTTEYNALSTTFGKNYLVLQGIHIHWYGKKTSSGNVTLLRKKMFSLLPNMPTLAFGLHIRCHLLVSTSDKKNQIQQDMCSQVCQKKSTNSTSTNSTSTSTIKHNQPLKKPILLDIFNVHLDDVSTTKRLQEIQSLMPHFRTRNSKVILGGDFNQNYQSTAKLYKLLATLRFKSYIDAPTYRIEKNMCIDHIMTKGFENNPNKKTNNNNNNNNNKTRKISLHKNKKEGCVVNDFGEDILKQFEVYGSDHLPIIVIV